MSKSNMLKHSHAMIINEKNNVEIERKPESSWLHCICVIAFDLELGQALETIYPKYVTLSKAESSNLCYLAFPDSNSGCMGDTTFTIRLQCTSCDGELTEEQRTYNNKCASTLQVNPAYFWGYVYFRQVKDPTLPRGYFQKSVVILSKLPFNNLYNKIISIIAQEYFDKGEICLEAACNNIEKWPPPIPGITLNLPLLGIVIQSYIPQQTSTSSLIIHSSNENHIKTVKNQILTGLDELDLFQIFQPILSHVDMLWELVMTAEPLVVMASSPTQCSAMVLALTRIISPLKYCADYRPYFTIHDTDFKQFTSKVQGPPPIILGLTNPFFAKTLHHWPHTIRLGEDLGHHQKLKVKKNGSIKIVDLTPGVYTQYKPYLQKDKQIIKTLLNGVSSKRPSEVQSALLKRHLLELTHSFMIPLERYIASLMPLQRNISPFKAAPIPLPFNPDDFFATLETAGPQLTSGIKGDWIGLYRRFFKSPNFNGWFNARYSELIVKLQILQLQILSDTDLKRTVQGRPEIEVIDIILKVKNSIKKCQQHEMAIRETVEERLHQRLEDVISTLPDDLKSILLLSS